MYTVWGKAYKLSISLTLLSEAIVMKISTLTEVTSINYCDKKMCYIESDRVKKWVGWLKNCDEKPVMKIIR